jgi:putative nucleotidyltransferase with HDIG domain
VTATLQLFADIDRLPTLPSSVARLSALARDERSSARDYQEVITHDPALTTNLLRLANSAFFGRPRQVTSVRQAVTFLGTKRVVEVALAAAFSGVLPEALPGYGIQAATFWRHCVAVAVLSERIADDRALSKDCDGFTCGLLHDIGKLVTSAYLARQTGEIMESIWGQRQVFIVAEHQILGADHAEIGAAVAEKWNLPEAVCAVVRWHHSPSRRGERGAEDGEADLVDVVHVADCLAHAFGFGTDIGELSREIDSGAVGRIGAPVRRLEHIVGEAAAEIEDLSAVFVDIRGGS